MASWKASVHDLRPWGPHTWLLERAGCFVAGLGHMTCLLISRCPRECKATTVPLLCVCVCVGDISWYIEIFVKGVRKPSSITGGVHGGYHLAVDDLMISLHNKAVLKRQVNEYRVFYPLLNYPSYTRSYDHRYPRTGKVYSYVFVIREPL